MEAPGRVEGERTPGRGHCLGLLLVEMLEAALPAAPAHVSLYIIN